MPVYAFRNKDTGEIVEHTMRVSELDPFKEAHPELERYITAETSRLGFAFRDGMFKPGGDKRFEEGVIDRIKRTVPGNTVKDNHRTSQNNL